jgi:hypothetical protein
MPNISTTVYDKIIKTPSKSHETIPLHFTSGSETFLAASEALNANFRRFFLQTYSGLNLNTAKKC